MHVIATAGHVDHGKSTLVRALTGMEPDRWSEERARGMTIDLGFAWTTIEDETIAFVDVPGHERFVPNMLAGIGPVPAVLLVVAADEGWMPQTQEHVAALNALEVAHGVLAITRRDLADPEPAMSDTRRRLASTSLHGLSAVSVAAPPSGDTQALDELKSALLTTVRELAPADPAAPVRLWVDRSFTIQGSGTVVTGTLAAGTIRVNDTFVLAPSGREVHVRALQSLGQATDMVRATARVAVNLRGIDKRDVHRGDALLTPSTWTSTRAIDVWLNDAAAREPSGDLMLHVGSAAVPARPRTLGPGIVRLTFATALPLRAGDIVLLRDPGRHEIVAGAQILDAAPPGFTRRGDAAARARELAARTAPLDTSAELRRRGIARGADLRAAGHTGLPRPFTGDWLVDTSRATALRAQLQAMVSEHAQRFPLEPGPTIEAVRRALDLPDRSLVAALVATAADSSLEVRDGRLIDASRQSSLPPAVTSAIAEITRRLATEPFAAPDAAELRAFGLGVRELAAAERAGLLIRVADGVVLRPDALSIAVRRLATLPQPFSVSQARLAWRTTRRVAVPLLELLDRRRVTTRLPDGTRTIANSSVESLAEGEGPR